MEGNTRPYIHSCPGYVPPLTSRQVHAARARHEVRTTEREEVTIELENIYFFMILRGHLIDSYVDPLIWH